MSTERFALYPAVHLFLMKDEKVLLLRRYNTGYADGDYSLPAGHMDGGEPARVAMTREAKEEIGLDIAPESFKLAHVMHKSPDADSGKHVERVDFFFTAVAWSGEPVICEPNKCDELRWVGLNELPENVIPYIKHALESFAGGEVFSEFGWVAQ